jgi:hypothetical protein
VHLTDTANLLDPSVNIHGHDHENAHHHSRVHGGGAEEADLHHSNEDTTAKDGTEVETNDLTKYVMYSPFRLS